MSFQKLSPLILTTSLAALYGSSLLFAADPSEDGCTQTKASCWDQVFCALVLNCLNQSQSEAAFNSCITNEAVVAYVECSKNVCANAWVLNQARPTNQQCLDMYNARKDNYCEFQDSQAGNRICGKSASNYGSNGAWADEIKSACRKAAWREYLACIGDAQPNISPSAFYDSTMTGGAFEANAWRPSEGVSIASLLLVPLGDETATVNRAVVTSAVWTGDRWERVVLGEFVRGADMLTEVVIDLRSIAQANYGSDLDLLVEWRDGDELVMALDYFLPIAESGIPGDFNRDGERTASDLATFIDAYDHNAPRADRNRDGVVNAADLELFLAEYDAG